MKRSPTIIALLPALLLAGWRVPACAAGATVTAISPAIGLPGSLVQIEGTGLKAVSAVSFHGVPAKFLVNSDTVVTAVAPQTSTGPVVLTTPSGKVFAGKFTVGKSVAVITGVDPTAGPAGAIVQIAGKGFTGASAVKFDGVPCHFLVTSDTKIVVIVPPGAPPGPITITAPGGVVESREKFVVL